MTLHSGVQNFSLRGWIWVEVLACGVVTEAVQARGAGALSATVRTPKCDGHLDSGRYDALQGYLAHKKMPPPLGPP